MLKKLVAVMIVVCCASAARGEIAKGQVFLSLGGGASLPMSDFGDEAEAGYHYGASFGFWLSPQIAIGGEVNYHKYEFPTALQTPGVDANWSIVQVTAFGKYLLTYASTAPYVKYALGLYKHKESGAFTSSFSESKLGIGVGLGVQFSGIGKVGGFAEAMYHNIFIDDIFADGGDLNFINLSGGILIKLGG